MLKRTAPRVFLISLLALVGVSLLILLPSPWEDSVVHGPIPAGSDASNGPNQRVPAIEPEADRQTEGRVSAGGRSGELGAPLEPSVEEPGGTPRTLSGRVVSAPNRGSPSQPIAGATVRYAAMNPSFMDPGERASETTTDTNGRFELPLGLLGENELTIDANGFFPHAIVYRARRKSEDLGDLALAEALMVSGRVLDEQGRGIESARILLVDPCADDLSPSRWDVSDRPLAITDATGGFEVPASSLNLPGLDFTLNALHSDYRPSIHRGTIETGSHKLRPVLITMSSGASVHGKVTGLAGDGADQDKPLVIGLVARSALRVAMQDDWMEDPSSRRIPVEGDGTFSISGLRPGETVALAVWTGAAERTHGSARRSEWTLAEAFADPGSAPGVELEVLRPVRVRARAVDASGQPIERLSTDAGVYSQVFSGAVQRPEREMTNFPDGLVEWVFHADDTENALEFRLEVEGEEGALLLEWQGTVPRLPAGAIHEFGDVTLQVPVNEGPKDDSPKRSIEVLALDRHGHPIQGASLRLKEANASVHDTKYKRSDTTGRTQFRVPADRDHWVRIVATHRHNWFSSSVRNLDAVVDLSPWVRVQAGEGRTAVTLTAPETAGAAISVTYGGKPLPGACLVLRWIPPAWVDHFRRPISTATPNGERTDGAGMWSHDAMPPGHWQAHVFHPQLRMPEVFEFTLAPGDQVVRLDRSPTSLEGRVLDSEGLPIAGALVRAIEGQSSPVKAIHERDTLRVSPRPGSSSDDAALRDIRYTRTDATGYFLLEGVEPDARLRAVAMAPGFVLGALGPATVAAGEAIDLGELRLVRGGRVNVRVPIGTEGHLHLDRIREEPSEDEPDFLDDGRWSSIFDSESVDGLRPGTWTLKVEYRPAGSRLEMIEHVETLEIRANEKIVVNLRP